MTAAKASVGADHCEACPHVATCGVRFDRLGEDLRRLECPYRDQHPRIGERLEQLEDRASKQDQTVEKLRDLANSVDKRLEHIDGKIAGALAASKMGGAIIGSLVSLGGSALIGAIGWLASRGGR